MTYTLTLVYPDPYPTNDAAYKDRLLTVSVTDILSLRFTKERYTPYTQLSGRIAIDDKIADVKSIELRCDDVITHFGPPDTLEWEYKNNCYLLSFSSRGYTCALGQNQLTPGMYYDITFEELLTNDISLPNIDYELSVRKLNYLYVKENDSMWDAAAAFTRKFSGGYPYIRGANTVRMIKDNYDSILNIKTSDIISASMGQDYSHTISHYHMKNLEGNYNTYGLVNNDAVDRDIIRHKHISFDRQWLSDPDEAMQYRFDFSERGHRYTKVRYHGYNHEDIRQYASFTTHKIFVHNKEISKLELDISPKGAVTTLWFYNDNYTYWP